MPRRNRQRVCQARMEIMDVKPPESEEAEIMEICQDFIPPKMIHPQKPKQKEQRLPGIKLLRRINRDHENELLRKREEELNRREEELRIRESERHNLDDYHDRGRNVHHENNIDVGDYDDDSNDKALAFIEKLRAMQLK